MKKARLILYTALLVLSYSCAKFEGTVDTTNKDLGYLDSQVFYELEDNFQVELPVANVGSVKVTLFSVDYDKNDAIVLTQIKEFGEKQVVDGYVSFAIPKADFGNLSVDESLFVLRGQGNGIMRESYIEYKSMFAKMLSYAPTYKGVEKKSLLDTGYVVLNKNLEGVTVTATRQTGVNSTTTEEITITKNKTKYSFDFKLSDILTNSVKGGDTLVYKITATKGTQIVTTTYKELVKVDVLANTAKFDLTFTDNCFTSALTSTTAPPTTEEKKTLYSIIEAKLLKYSELKKDSLPCLALSGTPTTFQVSGLTDLTGIGSVSFVEITSNGADIFKNGSRVDAENFTTSATGTSFIYVSEKGTKYYAIKLVKKGTTTKDGYNGDDVYFGLLEAITAHAGSSSSFDKVSLTLKYGLKRDYTKE